MSIKKAFRDIKNAFNKIKNVEKKVNNLVNRVNDAGNKAGKALSEVSKVPNIVANKSKEVANKSVNGFTNEIRRLEDGVKKVSSKIDKTANSAGNVLKKVKNVPSMIKNQSTSIVNKSINSFSGQINKISDGVNKVGNEVKNAADKAGGAIKKVEEVPSMIEKMAKFIFVEQIGGFFKKFIKAIEYGIVEPLEVFFVGLGQVFVGIFGILILIIEKIISIPGCIIFYVIDAMSNLFKLLLPGWLYTLGQFMYNLFYYIVIYPIMFMLDLVLVHIFGFKSLFTTFGSGNCFSFPASKHVNHIANTFKKIAQVFSKQFGRIDKGFY